MVGPQAVELGDDRIPVSLWGESGECVSATGICERGRPTGIVDECGHRLGERGRIVGWHEHARLSVVNNFAETLDARRHEWPSGKQRLDG